MHKTERNAGSARRGLGVVLAFSVSMLLSACGGGGGTPVTPIQARLAVLAGSVGGPGNIDGIGIASRSWNPGTTVVDSRGNVFFADTTSHTLRKIDTAGLVSTFAGTAGQTGIDDDCGARARFNFDTVYSMAIDASDNIYFPDNLNNKIRRIDAQGCVTTYAGPLSNDAGWSNGVSIDGFLAPDARFRNPTGVTLVDVSAGVHGQYNTYDVYVSDTGNNQIRKIDSYGAVSDFKTVTEPGAIVKGATDLFVVDMLSKAIDRVTLANPSVVTVVNPSVILASPQGLAVDPFSNVLYVTDALRQVVVQVNEDTSYAEVVAGAFDQTGSADGTALNTRFDHPSGIYFYKPNSAALTGTFYIADNYNNTIRKIDSAGAATTVAGLASVSGNTDGASAVALLNDPEHVAVDKAGNVYVADSGNSAIRKVTVSGVVSTLLSTGLTNPQGVAVDAAGTLYIADTGSNKIKKFAAGLLSDVAGSGVAGKDDSTVASAASFNAPSAVAVYQDATIGAVVYVADTLNGSVRRIDGTGAVTTLSSGFSWPTGIATDASGSVYVVDLTGVTKLVPSMVGGMLQVQSSTLGTGARWSQPTDVAVDANGNVFVADIGNSTITRITPSGATSVVLGTAGEVGYDAVAGTLGRVFGLAVQSGQLFFTMDNALVRYILP